MKLSRKLINYATAPRGSIHAKPSEDFNSYVKNVKKINGTMENAITSLKENRFDDAAKLFYDACAFEQGLEALIKQGLSEGGISLGGKIIYLSRTYGHLLESQREIFTELTAEFYKTFSRQRKAA